MGDSSVDISAVRDRDRICGVFCPLKIKVIGTGVIAFEVSNEKGIGSGYRKDWREVRSLVT